MKIIASFLTLAALGIMLLAANNSLRMSSVPPSGHTGATGDFCTNCHTSFPLNTGGGNVAVAGLPTGSYVAGQVYDFSLTISHGAADRRRWGFSIRAVNGAGQTIGTFSSTNANAALNGSELSHNNAVTTPFQSSYTYNNLRWTAPASPGANGNNVTFYYVGNAANFDGTNSGDYIYSGITSVVLPVTLSGFRATALEGKVRLDWTTSTEIQTSFFEVEKSNNAQTFYPIGKLAAAGNSSGERSYTFLDEQVSYYNRPVYYRLKMADKDGSTSYSQMVQVTLQGTKSFVDKVYPTLFTRGMPINAEIFAEKDEEITITVIDGSGRQLQQFRKQVQPGANRISFRPTADLPNGWVFVKFQGKTLRQTVSLTVY